MRTLLRAYPVVIEVPMAWGEMDAFGHMNNAVYFRYFENVRIAYFLKIDYIEFCKKSGIGPILASTECKFKMPLTFPDTVLLGTKVSELSPDRFTMHYLAVSKKHNQIAAEGSGVVVSFDYSNNCKTALPAEIEHRILKLDPKARTKAT